MPPPRRSDLVAFPLDAANLLVYDTRVAKSTTLHVPSGSGRKTIRVDEDIERGTPHGHCPSVRAHRQAINGMAAHIEHIANNPRCSLSDGR
jgi:hypothetical protein